jgi:hypothetical protein
MGGKKSSRNSAKRPKLSPDSSGAAAQDQVPAPDAVECPPSSTSALPQIPSGKASNGSHGAVARSRLSAVGAAIRLQRAWRRFPKLVTLVQNFLSAGPTSDHVKSIR